MVNSTKGKKEKSKPQFRKGGKNAEGYQRLVRKIKILPKQMDLIYLKNWNWGQKK